MIKGNYSTNMKICYIADASSIHTQRWVKYFADKGHEVHLISPKAADLRGVKLHTMRKCTPYVYLSCYPPNTILYAIQARRLVNKIKPDILDAHYITSCGFWGALSGFYPLILTAWGSDILIAPRQNPFFKALTKYALNKADLIICDSQTVKSGIIKLGIDSDKIRIVFNGVDTQKFNPQQRDKELEDRLRLSEALIVISTRNLSPVYNVEMLIKTTPLILEQVPEARFIIAGDGKQIGYLKRLASSLGVSGNIRFVGGIPHSELPLYLASSDIYVSTSLSDSTSLSLQEAMACEQAPVVTDLSANREWVTDGENGFIVPINNTQVLAERVVYLLRNKGVRDKFAKESRRIIQERGEYKKEMAKMEQLYKGLAKK